MFRRPLFALAAVASLCAPALSAHAEDITLYTTREPALIQPLLAAFTAQTKVGVKTVFVKDGLLERVKAEGERSPSALTRSSKPSLTNTVFTPILVCAVKAASSG